MLAWRNRGRHEIAELGSDALDAILTLRDSEAAPGGRASSWEEVEAQTGVTLDLFCRLVLELEEAQRDFVTRAFGRIQQAATGRHYRVARADGTVEEHWQAPCWQADAWALERLAGFTKPPAVVVKTVEEEDTAAAYAQMWAELDRLSGGGS